MGKVLVDADRRVGGQQSESVAGQKKDGRFTDGEHAASHSIPRQMANGVRHQGCKRGEIVEGRRPDLT